MGEDVLNVSALSRHSPGADQVQQFAWRCGHCVDRQCVPAHASLSMWRRPSGPYLANASTTLFLLFRLSKGLDVTTSAAIPSSKVLSAPGRDGGTSRTD